jgi:hypothetical protein
MKYMIATHDCSTGITTEREMTDEEVAQLEAARKEDDIRMAEERIASLAANAKLQGTRDKFLAMGVTQEEIDLIVPADELLHDQVVAAE